jgi:hypothetical protein
MEPTCPNAMMVHFHDTSDILSDIDLLKTLQSLLDLPFAGLAVMSTRRFGHFTFPTVPLSRGNLCCQACAVIFGLDVLVPIVRDSSRVRITGTGIADEECCHQCVEDIGFSFSKGTGLDVNE